MSKPQIQSVGKLISTINRYSEMYISRNLQQFGIGSSQMHFLMLLYQRDGVTQYDLAQRLYVDKATATRAIQKLELEGYIIRHPSKQDRRQNLVYVTEKALNIRQQIIDILGQWTDILTKEMSTSEKASLLTLLNQAAHHAIEANEKKHSTERNDNDGTPNE
ncbi:MULTISPECIES: MarR family winged helix-turn-helix transcriptional regulator [Gracilibacillus]|nr:MarR family winged helix-turn-helix transcriptional regulator [Gracilibacillus dipsosauri]